eukprot:scaffold4809_cov116-Cylindrotheca_fusiformis.AAC.4
MEFGGPRFHTLSICVLRIARATERDGRKSYKHPDSMVCDIPTVSSTTIGNQNFSLSPNKPNRLALGRRIEHVIPRHLVLLLRQDR